MDVEKPTAAPVKVDTDLYDAWGVLMTPTWSPDSKWLTFTKFLANHMRAVFVHSLETRKEFANYGWIERCALPGVR